MTIFDEIIDRLGTNSVKWDARERIFGSGDVLPLWVADMDLPCPPEVVQAIEARAKHPIYGYPGDNGALFEAAKGWVNRRFGAEVDTDWMVAIPGVVPGIQVAINAFTKPGDKVIIQPPVYPPFFSTSEELGRRIVENPLKRVDGKYVMDFDDLRKKIDQRTKLFVLCSPHNPIGQVWSREDLLQLGEICAEKGIMIIADEIHSDLVYEKGAHTPFYTLSEQLANQSVTFISGSKTFNLAGLFTSIAIIKNRKLRNEFRVTANKMGLNHINLFGIVASTAAYNHGDQWLDELLDYLHENAVMIRHFLSERIPEIKMTIPEATYLAWLDFRELGLYGQELRNFLIREAKVGLNDGFQFGKQGDGFCRMNFGCPRSVLKEALQRIEKAVQVYKHSNH
ncbi:MalY/PatB family protein [Tuberibacillus calidus]|uniref:MalY/PatB family protein n=1 Tax=Tuberibacillus calidus TaxID=340097 RepID=UPI0004090AE0|nr:PatB family C-S lyase [Tuberibacillus calidus]